MSPKTVLITGCSAGGLGSALVEAFHSRGLHVFATARSRAKMSQLENLPNVTLLTLDVTSPADIASAVETTSQQAGGRLDYLVNNSGQNYCMPILDTDIEDTKKIFDVNFWGALAMMQAFAPLLIAAKGTVVNIGSVSGHMNIPWIGVYAASKIALTTVSETLRLELAPLGVKVVSVETGAVRSQGQIKLPQVKLPHSSHYTRLEKDIARRGRGEDGYERMDAKVYADRVVGDVLGGASGLIWRGVQATTIKWLPFLLPKWIIDALVVKGTGLDTFPVDRK